MFNNFITFVKSDGLRVIINMDQVLEIREACECGISFLSIKFNNGYTDRIQVADASDFIRTYCSGNTYECIC